MRIEVFLVALAVFVSSQYSATITALSPSSGATMESRNVAFSFSYGRGNGTADPFCSIYIDGKQTQSQRFPALESGSFTIYNLSRAVHEWHAACEDAQTLPRKFEVVQLPDPEVILISPLSTYTTNASAVDFTFIYRSKKDELPQTYCTVSAGIAVRGAANALDSERTTIRAQLPPGTYGWLVQCARNNSNEAVRSETRVVVIKAGAKPAVANNTNQTSLNVPANKPKAAEIEAPDTSYAGRTITVMLSYQSSPLPGVRINVTLPNGSTLKTDATDSIGRASFIANAPGAYSYSVDGYEIGVKKATYVFEAVPDEEEFQAPQVAKINDAARNASQGGAASGQDGAGAGQNGAAMPANGQSGQANAGQSENQTRLMLPQPPSQETLIQIAAALAVLIAIAIIAIFLLLRGKKPPASNAPAQNSVSPPIRPQENIEGQQSSSSHHSKKIFLKEMK